MYPSSPYFGFCLGILVRKPRTMTTYSDYYVLFSKKWLSLPGGSTIELSHILWEAGVWTIDLSFTYEHSICIHFIETSVRNNDLFQTLVTSLFYLKMSFFLTQVCIKWTQTLYWKLYHFIFLVGKILVYDFKFFQIYFRNQSITNKNTNEKIYLNVHRVLGLHRKCERLYYEKL